MIIEQHEGLGNALHNYTLSISLNPKVLNNIPELKRKEQSIGILLEWIKEQPQVQHRGKSKVAQIAEANLSGDRVMERNGQHKQQNA
jgi:hypothetical protein